MSDRDPLGSTQDSSPTSPTTGYLDTSVITPKTKPEWSRRNFIKGVIASGVTVSGAVYFGPVLPRPNPLSAQGVERLITLNVNGQTRRVDVLPGETLAMTLRYKLGLTAVSYTQLTLPTTPYV